MSDKEQCRRLYNEAFGQDKYFDQELFEAYFNECRMIKYGERVAAMLFALPCDMEIDGVRYSARYIYAAATDRRLRALGYMTRLLEEVCAGDDTVWLLKPADNTLISFYEKRGFISFTAVKADEGSRRVVVDDTFRRLARGDALDSTTYTAMYRYKNPLCLDGLAFGYIME